jgi:cellobiose phosphorylase
MNDRRRELPRNAFGHFSEDGREFVVTDWRTPRPWVNLIANPRVGLAVAQTGCGFSWIDNSQLAAIVRWQQELAADRSGRFLYARDLESGAVWSLAPAPCRPPYDRFACRHGLGATTFATELHGLACEWTLFVDERATVEGWRVRLRDLSGRPRRILLVPFLEWNCGTSPAPRREFQKLFLETRFDADSRAIAATGHMWEVPSRRWGHWNTSFPYWSAFAASRPLAAATGDKAAFLGRDGGWASPAALAAPGGWRPLFGRHYDPVAAMACEIAVPAGGGADAGFALATAEESPEALELASRFADPPALDASLAAVTGSWRGRLAAHRIETPAASLDLLANDWLRYQAISARLWGRAGYYQQSGAYGFRDQLQDSQVWLTIDPERCREQVRLHARHQFGDGAVVHWWHPLTEQGHVTRMTDDLLWLAFVVASYLKETGDFGILDDREPFLARPGEDSDAEPATIAEHVARAFARVERRTSARGLPYIGEGDWNDGLSALGIEERGESVWLAEFLAGLYADWSAIHARRGDAALAIDFAARRERLTAAVNAHAWDGSWYRRATRDDGSWIGAAGARHGEIFLNAQTWAILADVAPPERAAACLAAVRERLVSAAGALLLAPAWEEPDETVGYITRYAPGLRENGGVYTHAATWAIAAAAKAKDARLVATLLEAIDPSRKDPERYWAEPYVLPGNVDGPQSPYHGRAGWTWYTGAAAWLPRILSEWVLGVRPTWDGLYFDPCLPPDWPGAQLTRPWRGARLEIEIVRDSAATAPRVEIDGRAAPDRLLRQVEPGARYRVLVHHS